MVYRQKVIGNYIVDFYICGSEAGDEPDGSQRYETDGKQADGKRDAYLASIGLKVLRYSNADINRRFGVVCEDIWNYLPTKASPQGEALAAASGSVAARRGLKSYIQSRWALYKFWQQYFRRNEL